MFKRMNALHWPYPSSMLDPTYTSFKALRHNAYLAIEYAAKMSNGDMLRADDGWGVQFQCASDLAMFKLVLDWNACA